MKVRGDFVTNSSSVSYILTMNEYTVDVYIKGSKSGISQFLDFIKTKMKNNGQKVKVGNKELYYMEIEFDTKDIIPMDLYTDCETWRGINVSKLSDEEIWGLIRWNILKGRTLNLCGIGATQININ